MPAKYNVVARGNPSAPDAPKKYYPSFNSSGKTSARKLAEKAAGISTLSSIDMLAALEAFLQIIPAELAEGNIVDLGEFGSFRLKIKSEGSDTAEAVSAHNITNVLAQFTPGKAFKQVISNTEFQKA
jgi:predicted histone-like DNA-binding protein